MREAMRTYHLFFPRKWLVGCVYILYPLCLIVGDVLMCRTGMVLLYMLSIVMAGCTVVTVECVLDTFMFSGIGAKECSSLEYVKSSAKGIQLLERALTVDGIRRLVTTFVIAAGMRVAELQFINTILQEDIEIEEGMSAFGSLSYIAVALLLVLVTELGFCITRRIKNGYASMVMLFAEVAVVCVLINLVLNYSTWLVVGLLAVVTIAVLIWERKGLIKKVRESYYDAGCEEVPQTV